MSFSEKIDEWIKEAETRPESGLMILKLIAGRLRELTERNEELMGENIALQDGSRVAEYERRINALEFELGLLKRRLGSAGEIDIQEQAPQLSSSLLVYRASGHVLRFELGQNLLAGGVLARLNGELAFHGELPRFLQVPPTEELLLLFSTGRISTLSVSAISLSEPGQGYTWEQASLPEEPHAGELLSCVMPLSRLPVSTYFLQASRRGCVKKTMRSISEQIFANHYLGRGVIQKNDLPLDVRLADKGGIYALMSFEGRAIALNVDALSYSVEERISLGALDYLVSAILASPDDSIVCITQNGKIVQREVSAFEKGKSSAARGQALIPPARLSQGTRFISAFTYQKEARLITLSSTGGLEIHSLSDVCGSGNIPVEGVLLSAGLLAAEA